MTIRTALRCLRGILAPGLLVASVLADASAGDRTVLCFLGHRTSHGFGAHEYHAGNHLIGKWLEEAYPGEIESRYSVGWVYQRGEASNRGRGFGFTGLHWHWNWEDDNFRKVVLNGVAWTSRLPIPEEGIESERPTQDELEANVLKYGGEQNRKKKNRRKAGTASAGRSEKGECGSVKPLFSSEVISTRTPGHAVPIDVVLPEGSEELHLVVLDGGDGKSCDWGPG